MRKELIVHKNPKSPNSEIFRTLRTNIQFMNTNKKMRNLLVTSTYPGEGKSWIASNLAVTFAQAGKKVVLIDADMRKGRQYRIFEIAPKPGLSNYLSEAEVDEHGISTKAVGEYIQETGVENLYAISAGNVPPNPSELLVSPQMIKLLDDLKELCDLVIIDGTPCELVADSIILSRIVDSCIIVTAHKMTKKDALDRVIKNIQNVGGKLAGVVINKLPVSKRYGQQYYYYGSSKIKNKESKFEKVKNDIFYSRKKKNEKMEEDIAKLKIEMDRLEKDNANKEEVKTTSNEYSNISVNEESNINNNASNINSNNTNEYIENTGNVNDLHNNDNTQIKDIETQDNGQENQNIENKKKNFLEKTNEIIAQINEYLNEQKNNLK